MSVCCMTRSADWMRLCSSVRAAFIVSRSCPIPSQMLSSFLLRTASMPASTCDRGPRARPGREPVAGFPFRVPLELLPRVAFRAVLTFSRFGAALRAAVLFFAMLLSSCPPTELRDQQRVGDRVRDFQRRRREQLLGPRLRDVFIAARSATHDLLPLRRLCVVEW